MGEGERTQGRSDQSPEGQEALRSSAHRCATRASSRLRTEAFYSRVYTEDEQGVFRYDDYRHLSDPEDLDAFVQGVQASALYDLGVSVRYGDELLTRSTCDRHTEEGRFALVAKRIK